MREKEAESWGSTWRGPPRNWRSFRFEFEGPVGGMRMEEGKEEQEETFHQESTKTQEKIQRRRSRGGRGGGDDENQRCLNMKQRVDKRKMSMCSLIDGSHVELYGRA